MTRDEARTQINEAIPIIDEYWYPGMPIRHFVQLVVSKLTKGNQTFRKMPKPERQYLFEQVRRRTRANLERFADDIEDIGSFDREWEDN